MSDLHREGASMSIDQLEDRILQFMEGDLSPAEEQELLREAEGTEEGRAMLEEYRQQDRALEAFFQFPAGEMEKVSRPDLTRLPGAVIPVGPMTRRRATWQIAGVAALLLVAATSAPILYQRGGSTQIGSVIQAEGRPQVLSQGSVADISRQEKIGGRAQRIKTPAGSYVELALADELGRLEMNANSSVVVRPSRRGPELELERGEVLIAAEGGLARRVRVKTPQLTVDGNDAVFSVVRGLRGSEVSVVSGQVEVWDNGNRLSLAAGQSHSSLERVQPVPVAQRVSWSPNSVEMISTLPAAARAAAEEGPGGALARAEARSGMSPTQAIAASGIAFSTRLLPADTFSVFEVNSLEELLEPLGASSVAGLVTRENIEMLVARITEAAPMDNETITQVAGRIENVLMTETVQTVLGALSGSVSVGLTRDGMLFIADVSAKGPEVADIVNNQLYPIMTALMPDVEPKPRLVVENGFLIIGPDGASFEGAMSSARSARAGGFGESAFLAEIAPAVGGSPLYVALDVQGMRRQIVEKSGAGIERGVSTFYKRLGLDNMRAVIASLEFGDQAGNQALRVMFDGEREGVMNWLGAPGAMGSLNLFSPGAHAVTAMKIRRPEEVLNEVMGWIRADQSGLATPDTPREVELLQQLNATLGNELAIGLENPLLPIPNIKIAVEVLDPTGFHEGMIALLDELWKSRDGSQVTVDTDTYRGHLIVDFTYPGAKFGLSYAMVNDFVVFGPGRAFIKNTIDIAEEGRSLAREFAFQESLPARSGSHVSWLAYAAVGEEMANAVQALQTVLPNEVAVNTATLRELGRGKGAVAYVIAEGNSIDLFVEGIRTGQFGMTEAVPMMAEWLRQGAFESAARR